MYIYDSQVQVRNKDPDMRFCSLLELSEAREREANEYCCLYDVVFSYHSCALA